MRLRCTSFGVYTPKQHQKFQRLELQKAGIFIERTFVKLPEYMLTARPRSADHIPFTAQKILLHAAKSTENAGAFCFIQFPAAAGSISRQIPS